VPSERKTLRKSDLALANNGLMSAAKL